MKLNKKSQYAADTMPFYAVFIIVVNVLFIIFILAVNNIGSKQVDAPEGLTEYLVNQRFLRSADCFVYEDISGRVYPLVLEWNKFTEETLNECYITDEKTKPVQLSLSFTEGEKKIKTKNWQPIKGPDKAIQPIDILIYYNNQISQGKLTIEMQNV